MKRFAGEHLETIKRSIKAMMLELNWKLFAILIVRFSECLGVFFRSARFRLLLEIRHPNCSFIVSFLWKTFYCVPLLWRDFDSILLFVFYVSSLKYGKGVGMILIRTIPGPTFLCFVSWEPAQVWSISEVELFEGLMMYIWPQKSLLSPATRNI